MLLQLRSELVKLRSTRTNLGLLIGMIGLVLGIAILMGFAVKPSELTKDEHQRAMFGLGLAGGFIAALIGVMSICSEFRHGTIRPTFIFTPKRGRVLLAKVLSSTALGAIFGLITEALAFGTGMAILAARGVDTALSTRDLLLVVGGYNSSNTSHLAEMGEEKLPTYFVLNASRLVSATEIKHYNLHEKREVVSHFWLPNGSAVIGITAGASCPNNLIEETLIRLFELRGISRRDLELAA